MATRKSDKRSGAGSGSKGGKPGKGRRSPAMQQFFRAKEEHPGTLLFFRMGDFYEMFFEDAVLASELLDIALTSRGNDEHGIAIPMAGVPHHAATGYIARLVELGQRVAVCEQMEDPSKVKGVVPRAVVRVVTPGLLLDDETLDANTHNYLAVVTTDGDRHGLGVLEFSTEELRATELESAAEVLAELVRLDPREVLLAPEASALQQPLGGLLPRAVFRALPDDATSAGKGAPPEGLEGVGELTPSARAAALAALHYAQASQPMTELGIGRVAPYDTTRQLTLDDAAVRNLELMRTLSGERRGSLVHLVDNTRTAMGGRLLRRRLLSPLTDVAAVRRRHDHVEALVMDAPLRDVLRDALGKVHDVERLATRASLGVATPRDLGALRNALAGTQAVARTLRDRPSPPAEDPLGALIPEDECTDVYERLAQTLVDEPPVSTSTGGVIRAELDARVAELRQLSSSSKDVILEIEGRERERTGIPTLRIKFTKVFGYYIEVSKARLAAVPEDYRRKQTVANAERFTTVELDEVQTRILNADDRLRALELELFETLRAEIGEASPRLRRLAQRIAEIDLHSNFAELAHRHDYVRPVVDDSDALELLDARHPIVEQHVARGTFVPNDVVLDAEAARLMVITGPNMAGKSTAMRQVALSVILAQAGCFVPARSARIGLVDRIYTRVGASDNVAGGESTFMVEMRETAAILHGATRRSLVILDEIGRGTSTYDGLSIAWAVAEHLHDAIGCRGMFATHYHELCELAETRQGVVNFNVAAREYDGKIVFMHKLVEGSANRSYGVAVAQLAGLPAIVLARARAILSELESGAALPSGGHASLRGRSAAGSAQLDMFAAPAPPPMPSEADATLRALDVDRMTPVEALVALARLKDLLPPDS